MKYVITLGAMMLFIAATPAPKYYQYKDISAKTARPFPEASRVKEDNKQKEERRPAEYKAHENSQRPETNAKEIR